MLFVYTKTRYTENMIIDIMLAQGVEIACLNLKPMKK